MLGALPDASLGSFVCASPSTELGSNFELTLGKLPSFLKMT